MLLRIGDRVRITGSFPISNYELTLRNEPGVVVGILRGSRKSIGPKDWNVRGYVDLIRIRLERLIEDLDEWDNEVHFQREINLEDIVDMVTVVERKAGR
jgi:hypothetical protein